MPCSPLTDRDTHTQTDTQTEWLLRAPFQSFRIFSFNLSSRIGPKTVIFQMWICLSIIVRSVSCQCYLHLWCVMHCSPSQISHPAVLSYLRWRFHQAYPTIVLIEMLYSSIRCSFWPFATFSSKAWVNLSFTASDSRILVWPLRIARAVWGNTIALDMQCRYHITTATQQNTRNTRWRG